MLKLKHLLVILFSMLIFTMCATAKANSIHFSIITPVVMNQPVEQVVPGHWQCVRYSQWNGNCRQMAWVPAHWVEPVVYNPYYEPDYYGPHHHHHHWG
jgi:hypothetical protein